MPTLVGGKPISSSNRPTTMTKSSNSILERSGLDRERTRGLVAEALEGADDGELYLEYSQSEGLVFDNGRLKSANFDTSQGFGLRAVAGEAAGYAHSSDISEAAIRRAGDAVQAVKRGHTGTYAAAPRGTNVSLYGEENPLGVPNFADKVKLLEKIDAYARGKDERVRQVTASLAGSWQNVEILRADGTLVRDTRPLVRINVSVVAGDGDKQEAGSHGTGGREGFEAFVTEDIWQGTVDEALRQALVNLSAVPAPADTFDVVLGPGWPGILLHEAVGHGLEGDFNRKKESAFAGLMGERVAAPGVTVIDDGTLPLRRGSLSIDDEGTPTSSTTLIEDGILVGYMHDRQNARLMGMEPTGNGRRQSYAHIPMPRMTNTIMLSGAHDPGEILASVKNGIYAVSFGGGQVDITSGKFVFSCTEAYRIDNGKIGPAIKGAMLIGNGPDALTRVQMVGDDMALDPGIGTCGKNGQGVPVGVGQPTLRIDQITVGGTATN
jgi:TldD protein